MPEHGVVRAIVAGHGALPDGLVSAVQQITGRGDVLIAFSNAGLGREEIEAGLRERLTAHGVSAARSVRFAWNEAAQPNLVNGAGLPALPFRSEHPIPAGEPSR